MCDSYRVLAAAELSATDAWNTKVSRPTIRRELSYHSNAGTLSSAE